jgi:hypothetical protein
VSAIGSGDELLLYFIDVCGTWHRFSCGLVSILGVLLAKPIMLGMSEKTFVRLELGVVGVLTALKRLWLLTLGVLPAKFSAPQHQALSSSVCNGGVAVFFCKRSVP